jgi:hypothetical protein
MTDITPGVPFQLARIAKLPNVTVAPQPPAPDVEPAPPPPPPRSRQRPRTARSAPPPPPPPPPIPGVGGMARAVPRPPAAPFLSPLEQIRRAAMEAAAGPRVDPGVLAALVWCGLGSGSKHYRPPWAGVGSASSRREDREQGFQAAVRLGLLSHHGTWDITERGLGVLVAHGMLDGKPAPELVTVLVTWGVSDFACGGTPQFVCALSDGLVDCWPQEAARVREREIAWFESWDPGVPFRYFDTVEGFPRGEEL